jgi:hypothetical protein
VHHIGDVNALQTSHHKLRSEYETHRSTPNDSPEAYAARVTMTNEVAELLKKHVVQGVKTTEDQEAYGAFQAIHSLSLRIGFGL